MYNIIDFFSGAGGLGFGFKKTGDFNIALATDFWDTAIETYKENNPKTKTLVADMFELESAKIKELTGLDEFDLFIGGPPCQGFSTVGKRDSSDRRNTLFKEYLRIVGDLKPKIVVMENVKGILSMDSGSVRKSIINEFNSKGYRLEYKILNTSDFGVPQERERVIFIAVRKDLDIPIIFPEPTIIDMKNKITLKDAISDLPKLDSNQHKQAYEVKPLNDYQKLMRANSTNLNNHQYGGVSDKLAKMMTYIPEGLSAWEVDIPEDYKPVSGYGNTYARLDYNKPGMTITRNFACISSSRCIHPEQNRGLSAREAARIQSFPDQYSFCGNKTDISIQIGNAVSPILAEAIADSIKKMLSEIK
ncbi:MAG: hypothetical protein A2Y18_00890 [Clostridiales bacterium GWD2_32_19]|nr:MAG: hypothetical protein A2Y18_00890 [Clostridiales bacterium GWD2_32_19]